MFGIRIDYNLCLPEMYKIVKSTFHADDEEKLDIHSHQV